MNRITVHARVGGSPHVETFVCESAEIHMHPSGRTVITFHNLQDSNVRWKAWRRVEHVTREVFNG